MFGPTSLGILQRGRDVAMLRKMLVLLGLVFFSLTVMSCEKLPQADEPTFGMTPLDKIPLEHGELVAVHPHPIPYVSQLWFQKPDKTLVVINVNVARKETAEAVTIPRR